MAGRGRGLFHEGDQGAVAGVGLEAGAPGHAAAGGAGAVGVVEDEVAAHRRADGRREARDLRPRDAEAVDRLRAFAVDRDLVDGRVLGELAALRAEREGCRFE